MRTIFLRTFIINLILFSFFLFSCAGNDKSIRENKTPKETRPSQIYVKSLSKANYNIIPNSSREFSIFIEKNNSDKAKRFYLSSIDADTVIFSDKIINGEIKWITEFEFSVLEYPGMIKKDDEKVSPKYIYNVLTNNKK